MGLLFVRADAGARLGAGHVLRCLALAQGWREAGGEATFALAEGGEALTPRLASEGVDVEALEVEPGSAADAEATVERARALAAEWTVVDGYRFGSAYQRRLKDAGLRLLWIDDEAHAAPYSADLVLNQNLHARRASYADREPRTGLLLGPRYALLRREFRGREDDAPRPVPEVASRLLVTAGGADPAGLMPRLVQALERLPPGLETTVVTGPLASPPAAAGGRISWRRDVRDMAELMAAADLAVAAAGSTVWELARLGVPALLVSAAANQRPLARELAARGAAVDLGPAEALEVERLAAEIERLAGDRARRREMSAAGRRLVDGRGVERVLRRLRAPELTLRQATAADAERLWRWANEPRTRAESFASEPIPWQDHRRWLERRLGASDCRLYVVESDGEPVGQVRFDLEPTPEGTAEATLSIGLAREHRGRGLGSTLLELAAETALRESALAAVHAFVKPGNRASRRAFENAGFELRGRAEVRGQEAVHYVLERVSTPGG